MGEHKFIKKYEDGTWDIFCVETTGEFNTKIWRDELYPNQKCRCCGEVIKYKGKKKR